MKQSTVRKLPTPVTAEAGDRELLESIVRFYQETYLRESRPQLAIEPDDMAVFLTAQGEPFSRDHLSFTVKEWIDAAKLDKTGSCHPFRHTMPR